MRMRSSSLFGYTVKNGRRSWRPSLVIYACAASGSTQPIEPQVGFIVSKKVGNAVVRNRVKRRLRHLVKPLIERYSTDHLPAYVVVRALPAAANHSERLAHDLESAWASVTQALKGHEESE